MMAAAALALAAMAWGAPAEPGVAAATGTVPSAAQSGDTLDTSTPAPAGLAAPVDSAGAGAATDTASAEASAPEPATGDFLVPIDGDVFYDRNIKVAATLPANPASLVLLLDDYPESRPLSLNDGLVTAALEDLKSGVHELTLLLFNERTEIIGKRVVRFFVRVPEPERKPRNGNVRQFGHFVSKLDWKNGDAEGRVVSQRELRAASDTTLSIGKAEKPVSQQVDGVAEAAYNVKYKQFEAYGKVLGRTDENRFRQPSDRIVANVKYGPWASLKAGDVYPLYNPLLLNGTRVRGGEASLSLTRKETTWGTLRAVRGESRRAVPAYAVVYDTGNGTRIDTVPGTYAQTLTAVRLGVGGGPAFDMGFTVMKASDDDGASGPYRANTLLRGPRPVDNLVPGIDLRIGAWDGRIQFYANSALSFYTRDRSLGAYSADTFDVAFQPKDYEDIFVFNSSTRGWQYLLDDDKGTAKTDVGGFVASNGALESGIVASLPLPSGMAEEFEFRYSHLGLEYHSEGNPFLGSNPGDGFTLIEKLSVLDNRVSVAMELGQYDQDLGLTSQVQRTLKVDLRFTPGPYNPSFWIGGGRSNIVPEGTFAHQFSSSFLNFNTGGYHQFQLRDAKLHATLLYGFTQSEYALRSIYADDTLPDFPTARTHIVNAMLQYKMRSIGFLPRLSYTFSSNGIQQPTNSVTMGFLQPLLDDRVKVDLSATVGQYPKTNAVNDVTFGAAADVEYVLGPQQTFRLRERLLRYGDRRHLLVGANYELYF